VIDVPAYLSRINYSGSVEPTLETLRALQRQHLYTVPFENLDIPLGRIILLDEENLFAKIVTRKRGGYCYELNGLFSILLRQLGFKVSLLSAGVWNNERFGPLGDHLCLLVQLDEPWIVDVGFGDSALEPLRLNERGEQPGSPYRSYRLDPDTEGCYILNERQDDGDWQKACRFSLQPVRLFDFTYGNHYMQTGPESYFNTRNVCTRATPEGRITLSERRLTTTINGQKTERLLTDETEWRAVLKEQFDIDLD